MRGSSATMSDLPDDPKLIERLDDYLAALQAGESPDREVLLRDHPELASVLDSLEALESLAPRPEGVPPGLTVRGLPKDPTPTLPRSGTPAAEGADATRLPRPFGQYELLEEIGRGGMGVVYRARQAALDREVAVKMILGAHLASPEHVRRFQAEAKAAARLRHSHIVHVHEVGQLHGQDFFAMEYIEGDSLADRLARGPVGPDEAVRLLAAVARAVDHLHSHEIVHRDLKPGNILIDAEGEPYVTDFGLAKIRSPDSQRTATGVIAGTPSYMAPEQAAGRGGDVGPAADVYSLGAILYEMLTGSPPFQHENPLDTLMDVLGRDPALPRQRNPKVPRGLELICLKCLAKSPEERYTTAGALADDLERFARGEALEVQPPSPVQRLWSWARRQPALAGRLLAFGVFYGVTLVNYLGNRIDGEFHLRVALLLATWALASVIFQRALNRQREWFPARFVWGTLDAAFLLAVMLLADGAASPLMMAYPLAIVGAGLWFRVRFVTYMTALAVLSYGVLIVDFHYVRPELATRFGPSIDRHVVNVAALLVCGAVVAYLVHRVRTLSNFYGGGR
jgi:eukaryotic-like serine/threonine-protein kinase